MVGITRRQFIATGLLAGGGLALGTALFHKKDLSGVRALAETGDEVLLNTWVKLAPDGTATVYVPHAEMGQGVLTSLPMMLADEMDLAWSQVSVVQAPAKKPFVNRGLLRGYVFGDWDVPAALSPAIDLASLKVAEMMQMQLTGGSTSVRFTGQFGMRRARRRSPERARRGGGPRLECRSSQLRNERRRRVPPREQPERALRIARCRGRRIGSTESTRLEDKRAAQHSWARTCRGSTCRTR